MHSLKRLSAALAIASGIAGYAPVIWAQSFHYGIAPQPPATARDGEIQIAVGDSAIVAPVGIRNGTDTLHQNFSGWILQFTSADPSILRVMQHPSFSQVFIVKGLRDGRTTLTFTTRSGGPTGTASVAVGTPAAVVASTGVRGGGPMTTVPRSVPATVAGPRAPMSTMRDAAQQPAPATTTTTATAPVSATTPNGAVPGPQAVGGRQPATVGRQIASAITAPANFVARDIGGGRVLFSWRPAAGAAGYVVLNDQRHPITHYVNGTPTPIATDTFIVGTLPAGTHTYRVETWVLPPGKSVAPDFSNLQSSGMASNAATVVVPRWSGRYRVTLNGFTVRQETADNPLEFDGKRDEVYFKSTATEYDGDGKPVGSEVNARSRTFGDINHADWKNPASPKGRIRAGSASQLGGLMTNDNYPPVANPWMNPAPPSTQALPLLLWEGDLREGDNSVIVVPTVWEDDTKPDPFGPERELGLAVGKYISQRLPVPVLAPQSSVKIAEFRAKVLKDVLVRADQLSNRMQAGLLPGMPAQSFNQLSQQVGMAWMNYLGTVHQMLLIDFNMKDRPIGMSATGAKFEFNPYVLNLSFENVEGIINGGGLTGKGPGIIEVPYDDGTQNGGRYTLYVQVHRLR